MLLKAKSSKIWKRKQRNYQPGDNQRSEDGLDDSGEKTLADSESDNEKAFAAHDRPKYCLGYHFLYCKILLLNMLQLMTYFDTSHQFWMTLALTYCN